MDKRLIQDLKNSWRNTNAATAGFLNAISADKLAMKPFDKRFTKISWEFACLLRTLRTRLCYLDALKTGVFDFTDREGIPDKNELEQKSKAELQKLFSDTSNEILDQIRRLDDYEKVSTFFWLFQHERIHHGKLMLYHAKAGFEIPDSFKRTWGESNFKQQ